MTFHPNFFVEAQMNSQESFLSFAHLRSATINIRFFGFIYFTAFFYCSLNITMQRLCNYVVHCQIIQGQDSQTYGSSMIYEQRIANRNQIEAFMTAAFDICDRLIKFIIQVLETSHLNNISFRASHIYFEIRQKLSKTFIDFINLSTIIKRYFQFKYFFILVIYQNQICSISMSMAIINLIQTKHKTISNLRIYQILIAHQKYIFLQYISYNQLSTGIIIFSIEKQHIMKAIRGIQFFFKGYFNFTKQDKEKPVLLGTLENVNYVITGANSGLGLAAAIFAASRKAKVYIVCRNPQRGEEAVKQIIEKSNNKDVHLILGQIGTKKDLDRVAEQIKTKIGKVDIFVHNAGCMNNEYKQNEDGIQSNYATNVFGVYYLTQKLIPCLHQKSRVIIVSSGGMYSTPLVNDDIYMKKDFDGTTQYARNKRMQVILAEQFTKMYKDKGVFVSMHPGWVDTPGVRFSMPSFYDKMKDKLKTVEQGIDTINYLSLAPFESIKSGQFYYDRTIADKHLAISGTTYKQEQVNVMMNKLKQLSGGI